MGEDEQPFTDSFSTDIMLLSSFLNHKTEPGLEPPNTRPTLLDHISTLLDTGNSDNSSNVVAANIGDGCIKFVIFTEGIAPPHQNQHTTFRGPQNCSLRSIILDPKKGAELLHNWVRHDK